MEGNQASRLEIKKHKIKYRRIRIRKKTTTADQPKLQKQLCEVH